MKKLSTLFLAALCVPVFIYWRNVEDIWKNEKLKGYEIFYSSMDDKNIDEYIPLFEEGKNSVTEFFQHPYKENFNIYVHATRASLDSAWQKDWCIPNFLSQCWMVASGVSHKLDIISPKRWDSLACEHNYSDSMKTQNLITHEIVHVFHGQYNKSPDFIEVNGIDWFIEGLATYASGQCDSIRISEVKKALDKNEVPDKLNKFWSGKLRYGLSGSVVMFLDNKYGREKLFSLLPYNNINDILQTLETTESEILDGWEKFLK